MHEITAKFEGINNQKREKKNECTVSGGEINSYELTTLFHEMPPAEKLKLSHQWSLAIAQHEVQHGFHNRG